MAGTADRRSPAVMPATGLRTRLQALNPVAVASGLSAAALGLHLALWGTEAPFGAAPLAGAALAAAGLGWVLWAAALFVAAGTPVRPHDTPLQLIEEGPYRLGRHPMYLGTSLLIGGAALGLGAPPLGAAALLFAACVHNIHIPHEETLLARRFGGWWRDYAATTRPWL